MQNNDFLFSFSLCELGYGPLEYNPWKNSPPFGKLNEVEK